MTLRGGMYPAGWYEDDHEVTWSRAYERVLSKRGVRLNGTCDLCHQPVSAPCVIHPPTQERILSEKIDLWLSHLNKCPPRRGLSTAIPDLDLYPLLDPDEGVANLFSPAGLDEIKRIGIDATLRMGFREDAAGSGRPFVEYADGKPCVPSSRTTKGRRLCPGSGERVSYRKMPWRYGSGRLVSRSPAVAEAVWSDSWVAVFAPESVRELRTSCDCGSSIVQAIEDTSEHRLIERLFHDHGTAHCDWACGAGYVQVTYRPDDGSQRYAGHFQERDSAGRLV